MTFNEEAAAVRELENKASFRLLELTHILVHKGIDTLYMKEMHGKKIVYTAMPDDTIVTMTRCGATLRRVQDELGMARRAIQDVTTQIAQMHEDKQRLDERGSKLTRFDFFMMMLIGADKWVEHLKRKDIAANLPHY